MGNRFSLTNVAAILGSGTVVMALYGVHRLPVPPASPEQRTVDRRNVIVVIAAMMVALVVPLTATSNTIARDTRASRRVSETVRAFGREVGWSTAEITTRKGQVVVLMEGPLPIPDTDPLTMQLEERGVAPSEVRIELDPVRVVTFD